MSFIINPYTFVSWWDVSLLNWLVSYYKCDTNGSFDDAHGSNTWSISWATYNASGKINWAYDYTTNDYINIDWVRTSLATTTQWSIMFWVKMTDATPSVSQQILSFWDTNSNSRIMFDVTTDWKLRWIAQISWTVSWYLNTTAQAFSDWVWHQVIIEQDWTNPTFYIDGSQPSQSFVTPTDKTVWFNDIAGLDNWRIACLNFNSNWNINFLSWSVDEIWIWNRALTTDEITALYNSWSGLEYSSFTS